MKTQDNKKRLVTRRRFIGTAFAGTAVIPVLPLINGCTSAPPSSATGSGVPNSKFGGVQIGTITYSYRGINGIDEVLKACVGSGVSSIELMSDGIEEWCGAPAIIRAPRRRRTPPPGVIQGDNPPPPPPPPPPQGTMPQQRPGMGQGVEMTDEEYAELEKQAAESQEALSEWRKSASMDKFEELGKLFSDAGVNIHIVKWSPGNWPDEEIDYAYRATQAMGAKGITNELDDEAARRMGPIAEKYGMYAIFHNHMQYAEPGFSADPFLAHSPANMLNFDCGHYFGSTGLNPVDFIRKYHDRIFSIHLKDKTGPNTDPPNANQIWGQGETPLEEVLLLVKENKWPIYCDIELEYRVPSWSDPVKEVRTCVNYCRQILI
jgi:sugar phosphate isomerase/epimerase